MAQVSCKPSFNLLLHFSLLHSVQAWNFSQSVLGNVAPFPSTALSPCKFGSSALWSICQHGFIYHLFPRY